MSITIPPLLRESVANTSGGAQWLAALPELVASLADAWALSLGEPFDEDLTGSWVAPCDSPYGPAVLKLGLPHFEADHEIDGLLAWNGGCAVRLFEYRREQHALLLERCEPGVWLRTRPAEQQDVVIVDLLRELWGTPAPDHIRALPEMIERWCVGARQRYLQMASVGGEYPNDTVERGLARLIALSKDVVVPTLLATDLHAGNVLSSTRRAWLVIDPKPHVGDACYDLTQHLLNCLPRVRAEGASLVSALANAAGVDAERTLHWLIGRCCLEPEQVGLAAELEREL